MKAKTKISLFFSLAIGLLGTWAFYDYYRSQKQKEKEEKQSLLFPDLSLKDLKAFTIISNRTDNSEKNRADDPEKNSEDNSGKNSEDNSGKNSEDNPAEKLVLKKQGEDWFVIEPVKDLASFSEVSLWLDSIIKQKVQKIQAEAPINWEDYGLGRLATQVELEKSSGKKEVFLVSHKNSFDGKSFLKKESQLFISNKSLIFEVNNKKAEDFRSKKILPVNPNVTQIEIQGRAEPLTLTREQDSWTLKNQNPAITQNLAQSGLNKQKPALTQESTQTDIKNKKLDVAQEEDESGTKKQGPDSPVLDQEFIQDFWKALSQLKAEEIIAPIKESKKYGLHKAQKVFNVFYGEQLYTMSVSPFKEEKAYVSVTGRDFLFEISKSQTKKIFISKKDLYKKPKKTPTNKEP